VLGRYFAEVLVEEGSLAREESLNVCLRMEQLAAYAQHVGHKVEGQIRGIERVKANLEEGAGKVVIQADHRGRILSDQKVYGLWGLYSVPARVSGLIADGPFGVTPRTRAFIEQNYLPSLKESLGGLKRLLAKGGDLDTRKREGYFKAIIGILPPRYTPAEVKFYGDCLRDAVEVESIAGGRQRLLRELLETHTDLTVAVGREEIIRLSRAARKVDEGLAGSLDRIRVLEGVLAPSEALFEYVLSQGRQRPQDVAEKVSEIWGRRVPNIEVDAFRDLAPEIAKLYNERVASAVVRCAAALAGGAYADAVRALLDWNSFVMDTRKGAAWVALGGDGRIDVRYRGLDRPLLTADALPSLWRNSYFINSLKSVTLQLKEKA
jgi:hypothetical protein